MIKNPNIFSLFVILGIPLLIQYFILTRQNSKVINNFWGNNNTNILKDKSSEILKILYYISILFATIAGIYLFYYLSFYITLNNQNENLIYVSLFLIIGYSLLWIPAFCLANRYTSLVLFIVSMGSLLLLYTLIYKNTVTNYKDIIAIIMSSYLFFHTFFLDGLLWTNFYS